MITSTNKGGQWIQACMTAKYLKKLWVKVTINCRDWTIPQNYDLIMYFLLAVCQR